MGIFDDIGNAFDPNKNGVANAFDPNKNGVAAAFDPNRNGVANALDPNKNGVANFFNNDIKNALEKTVLPIVLTPLKIVSKLPIIGGLISSIPGLNNLLGGSPGAPGAPPVAPGDSNPTLLYLGGGALVLLLLLK